MNKNVDQHVQGFNRGPRHRVPRESPLLIIVIMTGDREWFITRCSFLLGITSSMNTTWNRKFRLLFGVSFGALLTVWGLLSQTESINRSGESIFCGLYTF
uniref:Uncharacterized protein n=1 Tax=Spongospora subterranea TaxID=70186 RepID=A0A0H5RSF8_9EUKA|eukprot:CRZ11674.1 hypothetical protein [Spongospora subterranea]